MKIVYLHQYFITRKMAGGTRSYEMARRLVEAGHEVHMVTTRPPLEGGPGFHAGRWRQSTVSTCTGSQCGTRTA